MSSAAASSSHAVLRVGALSRLGTVDIRESDDTISTMILSEIFEPPYSPPMGSEDPAPLLFAEMLQKAPESTPARPVYSARVRPGGSPGRFRSAHSPAPSTPGSTSGCRRTPRSPPAARSLSWG